MRFGSDVGFVTAVSAFFKVMLAKESACEVRGTTVDNIGEVADERM